MRHIIHDWTDQQSIQILKNCRAVIPPHGRLFIVEAVVPKGNEPSPAKEMDMAMLIYPGGMERTEEEYRELFSASGFELAGVTPTPSAVSVVEGRPA
jgi:cyclopropane fatty-acyl-phospholipid synthase-like methyltransferase